MPQRPLLSCCITTIYGKVQVIVMGYHATHHNHLYLANSFDEPTLKSDAGSINASV